MSFPLFCNYLLLLSFFLLALSKFKSKVLHYSRKCSELQQLLLLAVVVVVIIKQKENGHKFEEKVVKFDKHQQLGSGRRLLKMCNMKRLVNCHLSLNFKQLRFKTINYWKSEDLHVKQNSLSADTKCWEEAIWQISTNSTLKIMNSLSNYINWKFGRFVRNIKIL